MRRHLVEYSSLTLVLLGAVAVAATAQERPDRERTFVFSVGPEEFRFDMRRGRMGITVDLRGDPARDSIGARVAGVTPGGPADRAGVRTGDLITRVNGTRLNVAPPGARDEDWEEESRPALRLLRVASRFDGGDTVRLDVRRGSENLVFTFVAEESDMDRIVERMRLPLMRDFVGVMPHEGQEGRVRVFVGGGGASDLELVRVNPGLGDYFGTSEGLLVVDVGSDTALGLRAGDVILSIGTRRPTSPAHAMRILGTYEGGEEVRFEVMRQKRRTAVQGRMPEPMRRWRIEPNSFEGRLEPLMERLRLPERGQPRIEMRHLEPLLRLRRSAPEIRIEAPELKHSDGWT
jgi:hypothetical protein